jgi:hypothetical protein
VLAAPLVLLTVAVVLFGQALLFRSVFGLRLRSIGERPEAAATLGLPVALYRYAGVLISGALAGLGGAWLASEQHCFTDGMTNGPRLHRDRGDDRGQVVAGRRGGRVPAVRRGGGAPDHLAGLGVPERAVADAALSRHHAGARGFHRRAIPPRHSARPTIRRTPDDPRPPRRRNAAAGRRRSRRAVREIVAVIRARTDLVPRVGVTLGSGLGGVVDALERPVVFRPPNCPTGPVPPWPATRAASPSATGRVCRWWRWRDAATSTRATRSIASRWRSA